MLNKVIVKVNFMSSPSLSPSRTPSHASDVLTIGELAERAGVAPSALRFYEQQGLIASFRSEGGQRRFEREVLRRVSFIRIAQQLGVSLDEIRQSMASLPDGRTPTKADWERLARSWRARLNERIATLEKLRDNLGDCIGCGCLSLKACALYNSADGAAALGAGPRYLLGDSAVDIIATSSSGEQLPGDQQPVRS
jgi:MerR family transcriptional regulator, redox-sensitive transcriptional activator SoxR